MLKRVLKRSPFPVGAAVSASSGSRGTQIHFYKSGEAENLNASGFTGAAGQLHAIPGSAIHAGIGAGSLSEYRQGVHNAVRKAMEQKDQTITLHLPKQVLSDANLFHPAESISEKMLVERTSCFATTSSYTYDRLKSAPKGRRPPRIDIRIKTGMKGAVGTGATVGECVNDARNLGNLREDEGVPEFFVQWAQKNLLPYGIKCKHLLKGRDLERRGLNLMYGVGKGSQYPPYLMVLEYTGNRKQDTSTALIGKGVTFDCGGLNLKPYGSMETMHLDMMGAATVLCTMKAVAQLGIQKNVVGAVGLVENAIGPTSLHPSTILKSLQGKTVEILNTDAEGRLVLADVMTFVQRHAKLRKQPTRMIDLATLTGAVVMALGSAQAGIFSNDAQLTTELMRCGLHTTEPVWPLPIGPEHTKAMKGGIADLVNCAPGREGGASAAAAFLKEFVEESMTWSHLDIAGTGMGGDKPMGFHPAGAPGYGVQLLTEFLSR